MRGVKIETVTKIEEKVDTVPRLVVSSDKMKQEHVLYMNRFKL